MVGILLPVDTMTADERRGFRIACGCMATWGRQISGEAVKLYGHAPPAPSIMAETGKRVVFLAEALDRTLGCGRPPPPDI